MYVESGVDVLELGGVTPAVAQQLLRGLRRQFASTPIVVMGYGNLAAVVRARDGRALADAVLSIGNGAHRVPKDVARIAFVSSRAERHEIAAARGSRGYVMLQANRGKTGLRRSLPKINAAKIQRVRCGGVRAPVLLGFRVSTPEQAAHEVVL